MSKVVANASPADGHGIALGGVATTEDEVSGKIGETVGIKVFLNVKSFQVRFHNGVIFLDLIPATAAGQ